MIEIEGYHPYYPLAPDRCWAKTTILCLLCFRPYIGALLEFDQDRAKL
jgi:hypothetical protein